jgi:hypothetical protein
MEKMFCVYESGEIEHRYIHGAIGDEPHRTRFFNTAFEFQPSPTEHIGTENVLIIDKKCVYRSRRRARVRKKGGKSCHSPQGIASKLFGPRHLDGAAAAIVITRCAASHEVSFTAVGVT